jgi:hypothetical protein
MGPSVSGMEASFADSTIVSRPNDDRRLSSALILLRNGEAYEKKSSRTGPVTCPPIWIRVPPH